MATDVAALRVKLETDIAQFSEGFGEAKKIAEKDSRAIAASVQKTTKRTAKASATAGTAAKTMGQRFAGAGAGISSATGALQAMGGPSAGPIGTVSSGLASLAVSGISPVTVALAAATTAIIAFSASGSEYKAGIEAAKTKTEALRDSIASLRAELELLQKGSAAGDKAVQLLIAQKKLTELLLSENATKLTGGVVGGAAVIGGESIAEAFRKAGQEKKKSESDAVKAQRAVVKGLQDEIDAIEEVAKVRKRANQAGSGTLKSSTALSGGINDFIALTKRASDAAALQAKETFTKQRAAFAETLSGFPSMEELGAETFTGMAAAHGVLQGDALERLTAMQNAAKALKELLKELDDEKKAREGDPPPDVPLPPTFREGFSDGINEQIISIGETGAAVAASVGRGFGTLFDDLRSDVISAGEAFGRFAESVIVDLGRILAVQSLLRIVGFAAAPATAGASIGVAEVAAQGVKKSTAGGLGDKLAVNITNNSAAKVSAAPGPGGGIEVLVEEAVESSLNRGGKIDRAIQRTYGVTRRGRRA